MTGFSWGQFVLGSYHWVGWHFRFASGPRLKSEGLPAQSCFLLPFPDRSALESGGFFCLLLPSLQSACLDLQSVAGATHSFSVFASDRTQSTCLLSTVTYQWFDIYYRYSFSSLFSRHTSSLVSLQIIKAIPVKELYSSLCLESS